MRAKSHFFECIYLCGVFSHNTCSTPLYNLVHGSSCLASPSPQDVERQVAKSFRDLNTEEVCQWFTSIGLQKCIPFIKGKTSSTDNADWFIFSVEGINCN